MPERCRFEFEKFDERHSCVRTGSHEDHRCGCGAMVPVEQGEDQTTKHEVGRQP